MFVLRDRGFYKKTALLMLPVILQQLITVGINFLDNIMIGSFGEVSIAAAAFSNQAYAFFQLENAAYIGLPIPDKLKAVLEQLHNRDEKEGKDDQGDGE